MSTQRWPVSKPKHRVIGDTSLPWIAWCASMNGNTCTRYCSTENEARYWEQTWDRAGGRVALVYQNTCEEVAHG